MVAAAAATEDDGGGKRVSLESVYVAMRTIEFRRWTHLPRRPGWNSAGARSFSFEPMTDWATIQA